VSGFWLLVFGIVTVYKEWVKVKHNYIIIIIIIM